MAEVASDRRIVMAKAVARRWLTSVATTEHRLTVLYGPREYKNLPNLLRAFRDGHVIIGGMSPISDLGVREEFDSVEVWSSNFEGLQKLSSWFERQGMDTTGIW